MKADFPSLLQRFFTDRRAGQLGASPNTIAGYRDSFSLLLRFASDRLRRAPSDLRLEELDAPFVGQFLDYLENGRLPAKPSWHAGKLNQLVRQERGKVTPS
jgi:integrase/recombinase XerD